MTLKKERTELLAKAKGIALGAKNAGRDLTASESTEVKAAMDRVAQIDTHLERAKEADATMAKLEGLASGTGDGSGHRLGLKSGLLKGLMDSERVKARVSEGVPHVKALLDDSTQVTNIPMLAGVFDEPRPPTSFLEVLPAVKTGREFSYLAQTLRENNAAPVARGGTKPTSRYGLESRDGKLSVVAHISEPMDTYDLTDAPSLGAFLESEMDYGIQVALEDMILNGDGVEPNFQGFATASGVQVQDFDTNPVLTARRAIGKVEALGLVPQTLIVHPTDWEAIETTTVSGGNGYLFGPTAPIERAARRLWSTPVSLSVAATPGTGWLVSAGSAFIAHDGRGLRTDWSSMADQFAKNEVTARVEGRFGLQLTRPNGLVQVALTGV